MVRLQEVDTENVCQMSKRFGAEIETNIQKPIVCDCSAVRRQHQTSFAEIKKRLLLSSFSMNNFESGYSSRS